MPFLSAQEPWLAGWSYRVPITVTVGSNVSNQQVNFTMDAASLISASKMRSDCGDLVVTDSDGLTVLPSWIQPSTVGTSAMNVWTKVPSMSAGNYVIYMYYGNPSHTETRNAAAVFNAVIGGVVGAWTLDEKDTEQSGAIVILDENNPLANFAQYTSGSGSLGAPTLSVDNGGLKMTPQTGTAAYVGIAYTYGSNQNWSSKSRLVFNFTGANSGIQITLKLQCPDENNKYQYIFVDNFVGVRKFSIPFSSLAAYGSPSMSTVKKITLFWDTNPSGAVTLGRFVADVGVPAIDYSGNGNNGVVYGCSYVDGKFGYALSCDGIDDSVDFGNSTVFAFTNAFTISGWFKVSTDVSSSKGLLQKNPQSSDYDYMLYIGTAGSPGVYIKNASGTTCSASGTGNLKDGQWHFWVGTFDGRYLRLYIDGVMCATYDTGSGTTVRTSTSSLRLGYGWANYAKVTADHIVISNAAFSSSTVAALYTSYPDVTLEAGKIYAYTYPIPQTTLESESPAPTPTPSPTPTATPTPTPTPTVYTNTPTQHTHIQVGTYYYAWYDPTQTVSWEYPKVQDKPVLGYYNSSDPAVIEQHFAWLSDLHIDFILVSWWGMYNQSDWHSFINNATLQIFKTARINVTNVKVALMVEPYNESGSYNFAEVYDWVYTELYQQYPTVYYCIDGKPLICFFNAENMTAQGFPRDDRFTVKIVGNDHTAEWQYDSATKKYNPPSSLPFPRDRQITVSPRFDDFYVRYPNETVDPELTYLYEQQWKQACNYTKHNALDYVTITSWNEYPERTAIEPHFDATASNHDPYYLYNMTKEYISELKSLEVKYDTPRYWYQDPVVFVGVVAVIVVAVVVCLEFKR